MMALPFRPPIEETMTIAPSFALAHRGRDHADEPMVGDDVVVEDLAELIVADAAERPIVGIAGRVADEHVDLAEAAHGLVGEALQIVF